MSNGLRSVQAYVSLILVIAVVVLSTGTYLRWWDLHFSIGAFYSHHWVGFIGAGWIAVFTPIYVVLKRRSPKQFKTLLSIHVFGNLVAFLLISIHFTQHMGRPAEFAPVLGTGLALYIIVAIMVVTGLMQRFRLAARLRSSWRFTHASLSLSFYIVGIIHVIRNLGAI